MFNGREQVLISGSCFIEFDQYFLELINFVVVYKLFKVLLIEGGVVGIVEL